MAEQPSTKRQRTEEAAPHVGNPGQGIYPVSDRFLRLLVESKVDNIKPPQNKIFVAQRSDRVVDVWKGLVDHHFLSCPVIATAKKKYYGFIDLYDITRFVSDFFGEKEEMKTSEDFFAIASKSEEFGKKLVKDLMKYPLSSKNVFHPVHAGFSLFSVIELLAREPGLHRVPIINSERQLVTVITQSQVVRILTRNLDIIGERRDKPVSLSDKFLEEVHSVHEDQLAIDAFKLMSEKHITGVAVVNKDGQIVGNISMRDLKAMSTDGRLFWRLFQTIKNFLQKVRKESNEMGEGRPHSLVTVKENETFADVIRKLSEHNIHRVYIVDDNKVPKGIISLKDILLDLISP